MSLGWLEEKWNKQYQADEVAMGEYEEESYLWWIAWIFKIIQLNWTVVVLFSFVWLFKVFVAI